MANAYPNAKFVNSMNESDLELYYAAELWSPHIPASSSSSTAPSVHNSNVPTRNLRRAFDTAESSEEVVTKRSCSSTSIKPVQESRGILADFPSEVLQEIFALLPITDLMLSVRCVCTRFNSVVSDEKFLFFKKLYFKYKSKNRTEDSTRFVEQIFANVNFSNEERCLPAVVWCSDVSNFHAVRESLSSELFKRLSKFPMFESTVVFLQSNILSDSFLNEPNIWNHLAALLLLCDDVRSMKDIVKVLTARPQLLPQLWIVDFLYCVLFYLNAINERMNVAQRLMYNLFYTLSLIENEGSNFLVNEEASSSTNSRLTFEQHRIISFNPTPEKCLKVIAFAGTGKTTTLIEYVKARPDKKFLVIFYNSAVAKDAETRFPLNAHCRTIHSIAYRALNIQRYNDCHKLKPDIYNSEIQRIMSNMGATVAGVPYLAAPALVKQTVMNYLASDAEEIKVDHAPQRRRTKNAEDGSMQYEIVSQGQKEELITIALEVWKRMQDLKDIKTSMIHDGYLKLFQKSLPDFEKLFPEIDVIMVDEAQDCNPATLAIVKMQKHPKIVVGDRYQQIYGFRGSINALDEFKPATTFYLTQSFRFGPEIAYVANCWLQKAKKETCKTLIGSDKLSFIDGTTKGVGPTTVICRSNVQIFLECAALAQLNPPRRFMVLGDLDRRSLNVLQDLHWIAMNGKNNPCVDENLKTPTGQFLFTKCKTMAELEVHAINCMDVELEMKLNIVKRFLRSLPDVIRKISENHTMNASEAAFIVTTVHKAKGMEFENVRLAPDFAELEIIHAVQKQETDAEASFLIHSSPPTQNPTLSEAAMELRDEYNLLYVAVTRSKTSLVLNRQTADVLVNYCRDGFQRPVRFFDIPETERASPTRCCFCYNTFKPPSNPHSLVLSRKRLVVSSSVGLDTVCVLRSGIQCRECLVAMNFPRNIEQLFFGAPTKWLLLENLRTLSLQFAHFITH